MPVFKPYSVKLLKRPVVYRVLVVQLLATFCATLVGVLIQPIIGLSVLLGGLICVSAQAFYNYRALRSFGDLNTSNVIAATYNAMWGKWAIVLTLSLLIVILYKELNAAVLYTSLFSIHTLGALMLPVLVKKAA